MFSFAMKFFVLIICLLSFNSIAKSEVYTVGDEDQWNSGINYLSWSEKYKFFVGDTLVFKYVNSQHDTLEVTEAVYKSCDAISTGVLGKYKSGSDQVVLTEARKYYFICNYEGHCLGGMRFSIDVKDQVNNSSSNGDGLTPKPNSDSSDGCAIKGMGIVFYVLAFGAIASMFLSGFFG